jgi:hypothetical protein
VPRLSLWIISPSNRYVTVARLTCRMLIERVAPDLVSTDDRDERWFEWKNGCYRACEKPARLQGVVFYSMG